MNKLTLLVFLVLIPLLTSTKEFLGDIPIPLDPTTQKINETDFIKEYNSFSEAGNRLNTRLRIDLSSLLAHSFNKGAACLVADNKALPSLERKMNLELKTKNWRSFLYKDFEDIKDFVRSSLVFSSFEQINKAQEELEDLYFNITKKDNSFNTSSGKGGSGYRDITYNFQLPEKIYSIPINKTISSPNHPDPWFIKFEVQLHICGIFLAKDTGHLFYEVVRILQAIKDRQDFNSIITSKVRQDFAHDFEMIKEILPEEDPESNVLRQLLDVWQKNTTYNQSLNDDLVKYLKMMSIEIYERSFHADQEKCIGLIQGLIKNNECSFVEGGFEKLQTISKKFVREVLDKEAARKRLINL